VVLHSLPADPIPIKNLVTCNHSLSIYSSHHNSVPHSSASIIHTVIERFDCPYQAYQSCGKLGVQKMLSLRVTVCFQSSLKNVKVGYARLQENIRDLSRGKCRARSKFGYTALTTQCDSRFRLRLSRAMWPSSWHASFSNANITLVKNQ